jgi:hypothetical protein
MRYYIVASHPRFPQILTAGKLSGEGTHSAGGPLVGIGCLVESSGHSWCPQPSEVSGPKWREREGMGVPTVSGSLSLLAHICTQWGTGGEPSDTCMCPQPLIY